MCLFCTCPLGIHRPECPLGNTGSGGTTFTTPWTKDLAPARQPWTYPRCGHVKAPHVDECACGGGQVEIQPYLQIEGPSTDLRFSNGDELRFTISQGEGTNEAEPALPR